MADVKFKKGLTNALPSTKTEGQVYFSLDNGQAAGLSEYTGSLWFDYDSTHRVKINKHADMADKDGVGNNIADTYISQIKQNESTGTTFKFQGYDANDSKNANEISLPLAGDVAGLISNTTQTIKGNKTLSGNTTLYQILSQVKTNTVASKIIPLPNVPYSLIDETHDTETYLKALIKWICANYTVTNTTFFGQATPNSQGTIIIHIYNTAMIDENGYPQYARGTFFNLNGNDASFGFYAYVWRYSPKGYASESDKATSDGIGQNIADTYIAKLLTTHTTANQGTQFSFVGQDGNGSNNANEITITGATASKAGLITTGTQTLTGVKTFDGNGGITITGASKFVYSGIESGTSAGARPVWFSYLNRNGTPVYNTNFTYDPSTNQLNVGTLNATNIIEGSTNISSKYLVDLKQEASTGTSYQIRGYDGAGTGKTIISIPAASATVAGLITTGAQTLTGIKTFNASGGITIQGAAKFLYSGIESLTTAANLPIWFGKSGATGTPGYNTKLTYNPSTDQLNVGIISATNILEGGTNISNRYLVDIKQEESTGTTYKIRGYDYAGTGKTIVSIPLASASVAGLISNTTQTITGDKTFSGQVNLTNGSSVTNGITTQLRGTMAANDYWRIAGGATASDSGYVEIATSDNGNEPIYIRQYSGGSFSTLVRTLTLLDASGNTYIPGILYDKTKTELLANNYIATLSNSASNSGTYVGISGSNTNASIISTIQLPNASTSAAGVITTGAQTFGGNKVFNNNLSVNGNTVLGNASTDTIIVNGKFTANADFIIYRSSSISSNLPAKITFANYQTDNSLTTSGAYIAVYDDHDTDTFGQNMVINSGGSTVLGSGESASSLYSASLTNVTSENLYLTSDSNIEFYTNCNTIANRVGVILSTSRVFRPNVHNTGSLGDSSYFWGTVFTRQLNLGRIKGTTFGRISWYDPNYYTWIDYMSDGTAGTAPTGGTPGTLGNVTTWAKRSLIQNNANYGWIWESTSNATVSTNTTQPTTRMALSAYDGQLTLNGHFQFNAAANQLRRGGNSVTWINGRTGALIRQTSYTGYNPIVSAKTTDGDWTMGVYSSNIMYMTYCTDTNFNNASNTITTQMKFYPDGRFETPYLNVNGTSTSYRMYINGNSRFMDVVTHTGNVNPSATNTYSLGYSGMRWSALYLGTADSYGNVSVPVYWNKGVPTPITSYSGNAATATKLQTARKINGTAFDGSADITTAQWGTARTISISATAGTTGTSINGSANASLIVPSTMTGFASITSTKFVGESSSTLRLASNSSTNSADPGGLTWFNISGTAGAEADENDTPTTAWWYVLRNRHTNTTNDCYTDLAIPFNANHMYYKVVRGGSVANNGWVMLYDTQNITYGTAAPNNSDGKPDGAIYIQLIN